MTNLSTKNDILDRVIEIFEKQANRINQMVSANDLDRAKKDLNDRLEERLDAVGKVASAEQDRRINKLKDAMLEDLKAELPHMVSVLMVKQQDEWRERITKRIKQYAVWISFAVLFLSLIAQCAGVNFDAGNGLSRGLSKLGS